MNISLIAAVTLAAVSNLSVYASAFAEVVKVALIENLSGTFAPLGQNELRTYQMLMANANKAHLAGANTTLEIIGFDGKGSPQESLSQLKTVIDKDIRYITQGNSSGVALALIDAVNKHNARNPGKEIVFLNFQSIDPDMTNSKCSFWHFRFDGNTEMKMEALTSAVARDQNIHKIFLIGQDYAHGHQFRKAAKEQLSRKRPDIDIVGDVLHPIATVKDFAPYVAKIKASGADTVLTGNFGNDLALLIKAAKEASLDVDFYTFYAGTSGVPTAIGSAGAGKVKTVVSWIPNNPTWSGRQVADQFYKTYNEDFWVSSIYNVVQMLAKGIKTAGSTDPVKVAHAMENMQIEGLNGTVTMRGIDHQAQQAQFVATWEKVDGKKIKYEQEKTGYGWRMDERLESFVGTRPTSCQMQRPV